MQTALVCNEDWCNDKPYIKKSVCLELCKDYNQTRSKVIEAEIKDVEAYDVAIKAHKASRETEKVAIEASEALRVAIVAHAEVLDRLLNLNLTNNPLIPLIAHFPLYSAHI
ncbi:MAG: hypothetical protein LBT18_00360 [Endomicrobium sp.]|nr:hypothetical protein [Endomicrobium sp.]